MPRKIEVDFKVLDDILKKDYDHGGVTVLVSGAKGSGKTTLLLRLAENLARKELVLWRGMFSCQWLFSTIPVNLILPCKTKIILIKKEGSERVSPESIAEYVSYYSDTHEVYKHVREKALNVVYTLNIYDWIKIFEFLIYRDDVQFVDVMFDEIEDLFPLNPAGEIWNLVEYGARLLKEFRKTYISLYAATQKVSDVDYRILNKINYFIYLRGAKTRKNSIVEQRIVNFLNPGVAIIEGSYYQYFRFNDIARPSVRAKISLGETPSPLSYTI